MNILYSLQHRGYVIPPQADAGWIDDAGGLPAHGNQRAAWDSGRRLDFPNPEYR